MAATAVAIAAWGARRSWPRTGFDAIATGGAAAVAGALFGAISPSRTTFSLSVLGAALLAAVVFELTSGLASWSAVRVRSPEAGASFLALWASSRARVAGLTVVSAFLAILWARIGSVGAVPWGAGVLTAAVLVSVRSARRELDPDVRLAAVAASVAQELDDRFDTTAPEVVDAVLRVSEGSHGATDAS